MGSSARFYDPKPPCFQQAVDFSIDAVNRDGLSNRLSPRDEGPALDERADVSRSREESAPDFVRGEVTTGDRLPEGALRQPAPCCAARVDELVLERRAARAAHRIGKGPQYRCLGLSGIRESYEGTGKGFIT
jgi:hypothetical protein